jgi:hypothetical protein
MANPRSVLGVSVAFVVGCVVAPVMQRWVVQSAWAQAPAAAAPAAAAAPGPARKWAQLCIAVGGHTLVRAEELATTLNPELKVRGAQGWELVSVATTAFSGGTLGAVACFNQPLP